MDALAAYDSEAGSDNDSNSDAGAPAQKKVRVTTAPDVTIAVSWAHSSGAGSQLIYCSMSY